MPPRTVANSDKEKIRLSQTTNTESNNPALTPTVNARTWHPATNPDHPKTPVTQNLKVRTTLPEASYIMA